MKHNAIARRMERAEQHRSTNSRIAYLDAIAEPLEVAERRHELEYHDGGRCDCAAVLRMWVYPRTEEPTP